MIGILFGCAAVLRWIRPIIEIKNKIKENIENLISKCNDFTIFCYSDYYQPEAQITLEFIS